MTNQHTTILGWPTATLQSSNRFDWPKDANLAIQNFLRHNSRLRAFSKTTSITATSLNRFNLCELRPLIGCAGLEGLQTAKAEQVVNIVDTKIRSKMAREWKKIQAEPDLETEIVAVKPETDTVSPIIAGNHQREMSSGAAPIIINNYPPPLSTSATNSRVTTLTPTAPVTLPTPPVTGPVMSGSLSETYTLPQEQHVIAQNGNRRDRTVPASVSPPSDDGYISDTSKREQEETKATAAHRLHRMKKIRMYELMVLFGEWARQREKLAKLQNRCNQKVLDVLRKKNSENNVVFTSW